MKYRVYLEQDEDGVFVAACPSLPGYVSQGRTLKKHGDPVPPSILEEVIVANFPLTLSGLRQVEAVLVADLLFGQEPIRFGGALRAAAGAPEFMG